MASRAKKVIVCALTVLAVGALYAVFLRVTGIFIPCVFRLVTGLLCPGCGVSAMCLSIIKLDFSAAFHYNPVLFCLLPALAATAARYVYVYIKKGTVRDKWADRAVWAMIAVLLAWGVVRNFVL